MVFVGNQEENGFDSSNVLNINVSLLTLVFKKPLVQLLNIKWNTGNI